MGEAGLNDRKDNGRDFDHQCRLTICSCSTALRRRTSVRLIPLNLDLSFDKLLKRTIAQTLSIRSGSLRPLSTFGAVILAWNIFKNCRQKLKTRVSLSRASDSYAARVCLKALSKEFMLEG